MIRRDFENGGFPVNKKNPIICFTDKGMMHVVYTNFELKYLCEHRNIVKAIGIWTGKYSSDCFPLNIKEYPLISPPAEFQDIDHAEKIKVEFNKGCLKAIAYIYRKNEDDVITRHSHDSFYTKDLWEYIKKTGKNHEVKEKLK